MKIRKILCICIIISILCGMSFTNNSVVAQSGSVEFIPDENMVKAVTDSERYSLWIDALTVSVCMVDEITGVQWWTNPKSPELDNPIATATESELKSQLLLTYYDAEKVSRTLNTAKCIEENTVEISHAKNGFKVVYHFNGENENFSVTLLYQLIDDSLKICIPADGIEEKGKSHISEIAVLPYLFSGNISENGYLLIPDGNGMIMRFSDKNPHAQDYHQKVYGKDTAVSQLYKKGDEYSVMLPILGMIKENSGLIAVIDGNEAAASLTATPSAKYSDRANASIVFTLSQMDTAIIPDKDWKYKEYTVASDQRTKYDCTITVYPLPEAKDYSDLAAFYRGLLNKQYSRELVEDNFTGTVQLYGQGWKKDSFFGFPIKKNVTATTFSEAEGIVKSLSDAGINDLAITLNGFGKEGYELRTSNKLKPDNSLGGKKALKSLLNSIADDIKIYWIQDVTCQYNTGIFSKKRAIKGLNHVPVKGGHYLPSTYSQEETGRYWWYIRPDYMQENISDLNDNLNYSFALGFPYIGSTLYSDYNDANYLERQTSLEIIEKMLEIPMLAPALSGGNLYAAVRAGLLTDIYSKVSLYDCMSESVPFYGMVFFGYVNMSSRPINPESNWNEAFLDCLEYGLAPTVQITASDNRELRETTLKHLINTCFDDIEKPAIEIFKQYMEISKEISGSNMIYHNRDNGVVTVKYSNGKKLLINRSNHSVETDIGILDVGAVQLISLSN